MENRTSNGNQGTTTRTSPLDALPPEVTQQIENLRTRADEAMDQAGEFIKTRPGTSLLIAAAAGYIIGRIVRS